jgi:hypothetical protein
MSTKSPEGKSIDFSPIGKSRRLAKQNREYLRLLDTVAKAQHGLAAEAAKFLSRPTKAASKQLFRQLDLVSGIVNLPHFLMLFAQGSSEAFMGIIRYLVTRDIGSDEEQLWTKSMSESKMRFFKKSARRVMERFFLLDESEKMLQPLLYAATLYLWTALECLAGDLWESSLNDLTELGHKALASIPADATDDKSDLSRRQINVGLAARYGFDLRHSLGTVLKSKFDFSSFDGIEEAYKQAFGECAGVVEQRDALKELEPVRCTVAGS